MFVITRQHDGATFVFCGVDSESGAQWEDHPVTHLKMREYKNRRSAETMAKAVGGDVVSTRELGKGKLRS